MALHQIQKGTRETRDDDTAGRRQARRRARAAGAPLDIAVESGGTADAAAWICPQVSSRAASAA